MPAFFVADELANGTLVRVLPQIELPKSFGTALYPRSIVPSLALRCLLDALSERSAYRPPIFEADEISTRNPAAVDQDIESVMYDESAEVRNPPTKLPQPHGVSFAAIKLMVMTRGPGLFRETA